MSSISGAGVDGAAAKLNALSDVVVLFKLFLFLHGVTTGWTNATLLLFTLEDAAELATDDRREKVFNAEEE